MPDDVFLDGDAVETDTDARGDGRLPFEEVEPGMALHLVDCDAFRRVCRQDGFQECRSIRRDEIGHRVIPAEDLLIKRRGVLVLERQVAAKAREQYDAATPHVYHHTTVLLAGYHFRRGVARTAASSFQHLALLISVAKAKINYFDSLAEI